MIDFDAIDHGFSREAKNYDEENETNPVIRWARLLVRKVIIHYLPRGRSLLEINAGTGIDANWLVGQGYHIHATDIADGMLTAIRSKIQSSDESRFTVQRLSFTELEHTSYAPFDGVFSNFGGLNCAPDLAKVAEGVRKILRPGGYVIWVFMPPICPWELIQIFRGRIKVATRRLRYGGVPANVGGERIMTYYFSAQQVMKQLGDDFEIVHLQSFSSFCPPMNMIEKFNQFPRLINFLMWLDEHMGGMPLFNQCGDFLILVARYSKHEP